MVTNGCSTWTNYAPEAHDLGLGFGEQLGLLGEQFFFFFEEIWTYVFPHFFSAFVFLNGF